MFNYTVWVAEQASKIEAAIRENGRAGRFDIAAWVVPSSKVEPGKPGYLHVGTEAPFFGADIVRLGPHGSSLSRCPYPHIQSLLWNAAKSYPILPVQA